MSLCERRLWDAVYLYRAALRCAHVQRYNGGLLYMIIGVAKFESVAISITNVLEVRDAGQFLRA